MDVDGNPLPGNANKPGVRYSDGLCKKASKIEKDKLVDGKFTEVK